MTKLKISLYNGKINNPKDLRDLEKELGLLNQNFQQLEDSLLDAMENVDVNKAKGRTKHFQFYQLSMRNGPSKHNKLEQEKQELQSDLHTLSLERDAIVHSVPDKFSSNI